MFPAIGQKERPNNAMRIGRIAGVPMTDLALSLAFLKRNANVRGECKRPEGVLSRRGPPSFDHFRTHGHPRPTRRNPVPDRAALAAARYRRSCGSVPPRQLASRAPRSPPALSPALRRAQGDADDLGRPVD